MLLVLCLSCAAAIDLARWGHARTESLAALDAALLGGGRMLQVTSGNKQMAVDSAARYFAANVAEPSLAAGIDFVPSPDGRSLAARGTNWLATPLLAIAGIERLPVLRIDEVAYARSVVDSDAAQAHTEVALALDVSLSAHANGVSDLRSAVQDLIDIVMGPDVGDEAVRIAIAPFAETVNVSHLARMTRGPPQPGTCRQPGCAFLMEQPPAGDACAAARGAAGGAASCLSRRLRITTCVAERRGVLAFSDAGPGSGRLGSVYLPPHRDCNPQVEILPLTSDRRQLAATLHKLRADGRSAGQVGLAWAWYLLGPEWGYLWTRDSQPRAYTEIAMRLPSGARKLRKIAVVLTSAGLEVQHCNGLEAGPAPCAPGMPDTAEQAENLCRAMSRLGIRTYVVVVGDDTHGRGAATLRNHCASNAKNYFEAKDKEALRQAMRTIALEITTLRVMH